jgi:spermidine synthase
MEVLATRMLSPYFGNTMYTFSSVIGVVLASLSVGYAIGGRFADRNPDVAIFYRIILLGGACIVMLAGINRALLPVFAYMLPARSGPLVLSLILFSVPSFLLGMLSPYVIALRQKIAQQGVGTNAGSVFFWSTLGSITGSLLAGFVLVPHFGITITLVGTAIVLLVIGVVGPFLHGSGAKTMRMAIPLIIGAGAIGAGLIANPVEVQGLVYETEGVYQNIRVVDTLRYDRPIRILYQDRNASSGMFPDDEELAFEYSKFFRLAPQVSGDPKEVLVLGAGAFTLPKVMLQEWKNATVDVVEIEPGLERIAQEYFGLEPSPRMHTYIVDGRRFLHDTEKQYDVIFGDAYSSHHAMPPHLTTKEFFSLVSERLTDDGVFVVNFIGSLEDRSPSLLLSGLRTLSDVFPHTRIFAAHDPTYLGTQNVVFISTKSAEGIARLCDGSVWDASTRKLCENEIPLSQFDLTEHAAFTDDFAPLEYLATFDQ